MDDAPYTNREIREKWHDIANDLGAILTQTTKTNGSIAEINRWRERVNGGAMVASIFMGAIVMPILAWSIYTLVHINGIINSAVHDALQAYNIEVQ